MEIKNRADFQERGQLNSAGEIRIMRARIARPRNPLTLAAVLMVLLSICLADSPLLPGKNALQQEVYGRSAENSAKFQKALKAGADEDFRTAIRLLREVVASDPVDFETWAELGTMLFRQGKLAEAENAYLQTLKIRPHYVPVLLNFGQLQLARKKNDAAIETLLRAVEANPRQPQGHYYLGEAFLQAKKGSRAIVHLNEALRLDPVGMAEAHLRLASLYRAAGLKIRAAEEYEKFLAKKPAYAEKHKLLKYIRANKK